MQMMELNIFILLKQHDHDLTQMFMKRQGQGESVAGGIKAKKQKIGRKTRWKKRWRRRWRRRGRKKIDGTVGQINQKYRLKYWATRSSVRSFARSAHSFACFALLALLARSATLTSHARSLTSLPGSWDSE